MVIIMSKLLSGMYNIEKGGGNNVVDKKNGTNIRYEILPCYVFSCAGLLGEVEGSPNEPDMNKPCVFWEKRGAMWSHPDKKLIKCGNEFFLSTIVMIFSGNKLYELNWIEYLMV